MISCSRAGRSSARDVENCSARGRRSRSLRGGHDAVRYAEVDLTPQLVLEGGMGDRAVPPVAVGGAVDRVPEAGAVEGAGLARRRAHGEIVGPDIEFDDIPSPWAGSSSAGPRVSRMLWHAWYRMPCPLAAAKPSTVISRRIVIARWDDEPSHTHDRGVRARAAKLAQVADPFRVEKGSHGQLRAMESNCCGSNRQIA